MKDKQVDLWQQFYQHEVNSEVSCQISGYLGANDHAAQFPIIDRLLEHLWKSY